MKTFFPVFTYHIRKYLLLWSLIGLTVVLVYFCITARATFLPKEFEFFWDPAINIFSVLFTIGLTFVVVKKEWLDSRPRRLNVHFKNSRGMYLASCYNVNILDDADCRALGLQVGQQMFKTQHLKINPSIDIVKQDEALKICNIYNKSQWIKYNTIVFHLNEEDHNDESCDYSVWKICAGKTYKKLIDISYQSYDENGKLTLKQLINDDIASIEEFSKDDNNRSASNVLYITNSPIIDGSGVYDYSTISLNDARSLVTTRTFISAVGHESTAEVLSAKLNKEIKFNRIQIKLKEGDQCLVFKLLDRIEEGKVYTAKELEAINTELGLLTKIKYES